MNFLTIRETKPELIKKLLKDAAEIKKGKLSGDLRRKTLAMLFEKPSTRTRISFEVAMEELGGHAIYLDFVGTQISRGETLADTARVLSRYVDGITARLYRHADLLELAKYSSIPVINALTDLEHPCQALGDLLTIREKGKEKGKLVYIGDCANNVANSLSLCAAKLGMNITLIHPPGYPPKKEYLKLGKGKIKESTDVRAAKGADVLYTDAWVSMGMEEEKAERMRAFVPYQLNRKVLKLAKKNCIVMHCLPAYRGLEITSDVLDGRNSVVWEQAENRLYVQKALLLHLLGKR